MAIIEHSTRPAHPSTRSGVPIRKLVSAEDGATQTEAWEQLLQPGDEIPLHYHDVEETVVFLSGEIETVIDQKSVITAAPMTAFVPANQLHSFRNVGTKAAQMIVFFPTLQPAVIYQDGERRYAKNPAKHAKELTEDGE